MYVSHNMNTIRTLCDKCIVLNNGRVVYEGNVEDAIRCYMGTSDSTDFPVIFNFEKVKRDYHFGKDIFIRSALLFGKVIAKYDITEELILEIHIHSNIDLQGAQLILRVKDKNNTEKIAAALSEPFEIKKNTESKIRFKCFLDSLAEDQYCLSFEIVKKDYTGNYFAYDNPYARIQILIEDKDKKNIFWSKRYWGNVRLPDLVICSKGEVLFA